jgi:hypothetical protein
MYAENVGIAVVVNYLAGAITGRNVTIKGVTKGPALYLNHHGKPLLGSVNLTHLSILNFTGPKTAFTSGSIIAIGISLNLDHYTVSSGFSMSGVACLVVGSSVNLQHVEVSYVHTYTLGLILGMFSTVQGTNITLHDATQDTIGWIVGFLSVFSFSGLRVYNLAPLINRGLSGGITPYAAMTIIGTFDCICNATDTYFSLPDVISSPPFYITCSTLYIDGLVAPIVRCDIVDTIDSQAVLRNLTIGFVNYTSLFYFMANSTVDVDLMSISSGVLTSCILTITHSNVTFTNSTIGSLYYKALAFLMFSKLEVRSMSLVSVTSVWMLPYIFRSQFEVVGFHAINSVFDLVDLSFSSGAFKQVLLENHTAIGNFIKMNSAQLLFEDFAIKGLSVRSDKLFMRAQRGSQVVFRRAVLQEFKSEGSHFSDIKHSNVTFDNCLIEGFTATWIHASATYIEVQASWVREGGIRSVDVKSWSTAGFLMCKACHLVKISDSYFVGIMGKNGGVLSIDNSKVSIGDSIFVRCQVANKGGVLYSIDSDLTIMNSTFNANAAVMGGVLYHDSQTKVARFDNCSFIENHVVVIHPTSRFLPTHSGKLCYLWKFRGHSSLPFGSGKCFFWTCDRGEWDSWNYSRNSGDQRYSQSNSRYRELH